MKTPPRPGRRSVVKGGVLAHRGKALGSSAALGSIPEPSTN